MTFYVSINECDDVESYMYTVPILMVAYFSLTRLKLSDGVVPLNGLFQPNRAAIPEWPTCCQ